jgi:hypothetical protein
MWLLSFLVSIPNFSSRLASFVAKTTDYRYKSVSKKGQFGQSIIYKWIESFTTKKNTSWNQPDTG